jgi:hypothetical protein
MHMTKQSHAFAGLALILAALCLAPASGNDLPTAPKPIPDASIRFEQNATDGDVEVVFELTGPDEGLTQLTVVAPDGRTIVDFTVPDAKKYGIREFVFESPEPEDVEGLKAAYPAGEYTFQGMNTAGVKLRSTARLSHELPATVSFLQPTPRARGVDSQNLEITWTPVENVAGYVIELEQSKLDVKLTSKQPASMAKFAVPDGLLAPGVKYQLGIGTVSADGNISFVETSFTTASDE